MESCPGAVEGPRRHSRRGAAAVRRAAAADARLTVVTVAVTESQGAGCCDTRAGYWNGVVRGLAGEDLERARSLVGGTPGPRPSRC